MERIVEIKENDEIHYEVQHKMLFWWETYQNIDSFEEFSNKKFPTLEEALLFVNSLQKKPKVVWQSNK